MCNMTSTCSGVCLSTSQHLPFKLGCSSGPHVARSLVSSLQQTSLPHLPIERNKYSSRRMMPIGKSFSVVYRLSAARALLGTSPYTRCMSASSAKLYRYCSIAFPNFATFTITLSLSLSLYFDSSFLLKLNKYVLNK